jgi:hypothetical protein
MAGRWKGKRWGLEGARKRVWRGGGDNNTDRKKGRKECTSRREDEYRYKRPYPIND